jgi:Fe2+ transport system protein FeoA
MERFVPLTRLAPHEKGTIGALDGGRGFVSRMASLGFTPGAPVIMVQNFGRGPLIVLVRDARIALGRGEASKVLVKHKDNDDGEEKG